MNEINLIPDKILYRNRRLAGFGAKVLLTLVGVIAVGFLLLIPTLRRMDMQNKLNDLNALIDSSNSIELKNAEDLLNLKISESSSLTSMLRSIPNSTMKSADLLDRISRLMPATLVSSDIQFEAQNGKLNIRVSSNRRPDISTFLERLYNDDLFSNISISDIQNANNKFETLVTIVLKK